jgi:hypothetical protein
LRAKQIYFAILYDAALKARTGRASAGHILPAAFVDANLGAVRASLLSGLMIALTIAATGCASAGVSLPPLVEYSEIEPSGHAAKPPGCQMPVLRSEPLAEFRKVAIIEATGNVFATEDQVLPALLRKACESGADAVVILVSKSQTSEARTGYYIDSVAIVYGPETGTGVSSGFRPPTAK